MDPGRLDAIARWLGRAGRTRRGVARLLAAAGLGSLLGGRGGDGSAECTKRGKPCKHSIRCCRPNVCRRRRCRLPHRTCLAYGEPCMIESHCCDGVPCTGGRCRYP